MSKYQITNPNNSIVRDCKSRTTEEYSAGLQIPHDGCEDPKWSKKYKRKQQLNLKKGKFRFKLLYANNISLDDNKTLTSNEFEIY